MTSKDNKDRPYDPFEEEPEGLTSVQRIEWLLKRDAMRKMKAHTLVASNAHGNQNMQNLADELLEKSFESLDLLNGRSQ